MSAPSVVVVPTAELAELVRGVIREELEGRAPAAESEPLLLTCAALCRRLGVSRTSVFRWRGEGMPSIRAGDEHRYILAEVLEWLRSRRTGADGSQPAGALTTGAR